MLKNFAIVSQSTKAPYTKVKEIPIPNVPSNKILIRSVAFAVNPLDVSFKVFGLKKDAILGSDVSGVVEAVGSNVKGFAEGDRVSAWVQGNFSDKEGGFANYVVANPTTTLKYDSKKFSFSQAASASYGRISSFEGAAAVTLSLSIVGLNFSFGFDLNDSDRVTNGEKYILIWGGASSSGVAAIQLAKKIYGLKVITTASPKHHKFLSELGADYLFDYNDAEVVSKIRSAGKGKIYYGLDTISKKETFQQVYDATSETKDVTLINLLYLNESLIEADASRDDVTFKSLSGFLALGEDVTFAGKVISPPKEATEKYNHYWTNLLPKILPEIYHPSLKLFGPGLEKGEAAVAFMVDKKASGEKAIIRV